MRLNGTDGREMDGIVLNGAAVNDCRRRVGSTSNNIFGSDDDDGAWNCVFSCYSALFFPCPASG